MLDVRDVDGLAAVPAEHLDAELLATAAHVAAGTCAFLVLVGEFDRRRAYESWECVSTAQWLGWQCGIGGHAAREQVRVGRRLLELPSVRAAFAEGRLSYSKVRAITRVAHPGIEEGLVALAEHATASITERACSALRRCVDPVEEDADLGERERRGRERCHVSFWRDDSGHLVGSFRLAPDDGEVLTRALASAGQALVPSAEGEREPVERVRARALVAMAADHLAHPPSGDDPTPELVVHVDAAALAALRPAALHPADPGDVPAGTPPPVSPDAADVPTGTPPRGWRSPGWRWPVRTSGGIPLSLSALERLGCDTGIRWVADEPDGSTLDLGRRRRTPGRALLRALRARDRHCRFPGCTARRGLHAHHIRWWSRGGPTDRDNLVLLCSRHHHAVHDRSWRCSGRADHLEFSRPGGAVVPSGAPPMSGSLAELISATESAGIDVAVESPGGHWMGDRVDWDCFFAAFAPAGAGVHP